MVTKHNTAFYIWYSKSQHLFLFIVIYYFIFIYCIIFIYYNKTDNVTPRDASVCGMLRWDQIKPSNAM